MQCFRKSRLSSGSNEKGLHMKHSWPYSFPVVKANKNEV